MGLSTISPAKICFLLFYRVCKLGTLYNSSGPSLWSWSAREFMAFFDLTSFLVLRMTSKKINKGPDQISDWSSRFLRGYSISSGGWFGTFFIFPYIGNNHPNWLSYFQRGGPTTNQSLWEWEVDVTRFEIKLRIFHKVVPQFLNAFSWCK